MDKRENNFTRAGNIFPCFCVDIDDYMYGSLNVYFYNQPEEHISIGRYSSIANDVKFIWGYDSSHLTTYPFKNRVTYNKIQEATTKGLITKDFDLSKIDYENSTKLFDALYIKLTTDNINTMLKLVTEK